MHTQKIIRALSTGTAALTLALSSGCHSKPAATTDASLTAQAQTTISSDQNLSGQSIQASATSGVITLDGNVTSDTARTIASQDVAQLQGVKTVVNNLVINAQSSQASAVVNTQLPAPIQTVTSRTEKTKKPAQIAQAFPPPAPIERSIQTPYTPPAPAPEPLQAAPPPPPPAPVVHNITLPAGTAIPVRITETLDSATTQTGDKFTGSIASDIIVDGLVVLPQGTPIAGHVDEAKDAAHFKGSSLLTISLSAINRKGDHLEVATEPYTKEGEGRGKNTAEKVGGGAAVGAILGGIFGGGKGAAIGAAAGGGVGAGAQGVTRGQQVQIESETVVRFKLSDSILVRVTSGSGNSGTNDSLERRTDR